jgi:glutathione synthase/RimK-type ligase-like ATP-grasp enzyme
MSSIFDRFELSSFRRLWNNAKAVHDYSHKPTLLILADMAQCILRDHIGYMEYNLFHFVGKPQKLRDTYVTFDYSQHLFKTLNDPEYLTLFNDKLSFNKIFKDYLGRDFLDLSEAGFDDFATFCKGKDRIFAKPNDSCSGKGIYRNFVIDETTDLKELYDYLRENHLFVEDSIVQDKKMASLHPSSINTIRVTTVLDRNDEAHVMYALQRIGIGDMSVDNVGSGGIYTVLSEDGRIENPCWSDKTISTYVKHPTTGMELIGFAVPCFKEALQLCKKAAEVEKHIRYVGWDIAISDKGPVIVEGNPLPGYDMPQNYFVTNKDSGLKPAFEEILSK